MKISSKTKLFSTRLQPKLHLIVAEDASSHRQMSRTWQNSSNKNSKYEDYYGRLDILWIGLRRGRNARYVAAEERMEKHCNTSRWLLWMILVTLQQPACHTTEITSQVFGTNVNLVPAAFGDFNSDELTDLFITQDKGHSIDILLGSNDPGPLLHKVNLKCDLGKACVATSLVPGDFNGDAFMDLLVVVSCHHEHSLMQAHLMVGGPNGLNCTFDVERPLLETRGEPLAIDYNNDFIIDLFGVSPSGDRGYWIFAKQGRPTFLVQEARNLTLPELRHPHSNAFLDLNSDNRADIFVTSEKFFEMWENTGSGFEFKLMLVPPVAYQHLGQSIFLDLQLMGKMDHILPVVDKTNSKIFVFSNNTWIDLKVNFVDPQGVPWSFHVEKEGPPFVNTITVRGGDYNMDGYPDLLATLESKYGSRALLLENVPCDTGCSNFSRGFQVQWTSFAEQPNNTVLGVFYDIFQDGILDAILVHHADNDGLYAVSAHKNNLDYDTNFVKVMVLTGLNRTGDEPYVPGPLGKRSRTFGTNLPGPQISYKTTDQDGNLRAGVNAQIPQSAHFALHLPYTMFALGRTPNFVDNITVGFAGYKRDWPQIIPNSQMVVIPAPLTHPWQWKVQLFVTPSKVILMSAAALLATCVFIVIVIAALHWKERKMDRLERLQEAYRFNFEAM